MKTNSQKTNQIWMPAAIGFALLLMALGPQSAFAQTNTFPSTGNVGVGTTSPGAKVHISGAASGVTPSSTLAQVAVENSGSAGIQILNPDNQIGRILFGTPSAASGGGAQPGVSALIRWDYTNKNFDFATDQTNGYLRFLTGTFVERMRINANGNVGIGTTSPGYLLHLKPASGGVSFLMEGAATADLFESTGVDPINGPALNFGYAGGTFGRGAGFFNVRPDASATGINPALYFLTQNVTRMVIDKNGNVGVGTSTPGYKLDVSGNMNATGTINAVGGLNVNGSPVTSSQWATSGSNINYATAGNVGIGTASPGSKLDVTGNINASGTINAVGGLNINGSPVTSSQWTTSGSNINYATAGNVGIGTASPGSKLDVTGNINASGTINAVGGVNINGSPVTSSQWTTSGSNINYATAGNVGIGTSTPTSKLHVTGDGRFTGNLTVDGNLAAKYQDVAEWVPASEQLAAGTVVVLDSTKSNQVISSTQAYDTRVAGVVSEQPGITLGEGGSNKVLVATTGRVLVKVDASRGPIHIGDLLVTSDVPGLAMKSEPINLGGVQLHRPGTLIGKALEPLAKGEGRILVLLSLQ